MVVIIWILKIIIVFLLSKHIYNRLEIQDTSAFYQLITLEETKRMRVPFYTSLLKLEACFKKLSIPFNIFTLSITLGIGIISFLVVFFVCNLIFKQQTVKYIIAIPFVFTGGVIVKWLANIKQERLEDGLSDFFIQLKSALRVNSDVIEALRRIQNSVLEPFSTYTKQLLTEINAGKLPDIALESFSQKVGIEKFTLYINSIRYCHIYGGDVGVLTEKTQEIIVEAIKQKKKRIKETKAICIVLYALILIDFYMYFAFINSNLYYSELMSNTFIGQLIVNVNFISIWVMMWLSNVVKKFDY